MEIQKELTNQIKRSMVYYHETMVDSKPLNMYDFICDKKRIISNDFCTKCGNFKDLWLRKGISKCILCKCR